MNDLQLIAWDIETQLIGYGQVIPPFICATATYPTEGGLQEDIVCVQDADHVEYLKWLVASDKEIVLHNSAYDLAVLAVNYPETLPLIWQALDDERVHDTLIREMLFNLTNCGNIDMVEVRGAQRRAEYSLTALGKLYLGKDRSDQKEGDDVARTNYHLVEDKPLSEWPDEFIDYAKEDATDTLKIYLEQEKAGKKLLESIGYDPFVTEGFRVRAAFALQLMTNHGNLLDKERVLAVTQEYLDLYNDPKLVEPLIHSRYIRAYAEANDTDITKELIEEALLSFEKDLSPEEQKAWRGGIIVPAVPPTPYANGALNHLDTCYGHKDHPDYPGKTVKDCGCPPKMKAGVAESGSTKELWGYIWEVGRNDDRMEVWAGKALRKELKESGLSEKFLTDTKVIDQKAVEEYQQEKIDALLKQGIVPEFFARDLPKGWRVSTDKEWMASFALLNPLLELYSTRKKYEKIITSYLPGLYWKKGELNCPAVLPGETSKLGGKEPSDIVHSGFRVLKRTGRSSSAAIKKGKGAKEVYLCPSMNGQQVDPRIRQCVVPRKGYKLFSVDLAAMELGTLAQECISVFGFSVLGDLINAGEDVHAYLATAIARKLDSHFKKLAFDLDEMSAYQLFKKFKKDKSLCESPDFAEVWETLRREGSPLWENIGHEGLPLWKDFYKYYRTFAKPTGLGYPGGLGPRTFTAYAKATYGISVTLGIATELRKIWRDTFPEMKLYLELISKHSADPVHMPEMSEDKDGKAYKRRFYAYDTPMGLHRAKCDFCACANGRGLQSPSAEGALLGLQEIQRAITCGDPGILADVDGEAMVRPTIFIHDEIFGEIKDDELLTERIEAMQQIMKDCMELITPDVRANTEPAIMNRWSKGAFEYRVDGKLRPYEEGLKRFYYVHPESSSIWQTVEREESPEVMELTKEEYLDLEAEGIYTRIPFG